MLSQTLFTFQLPTKIIHGVNATKGTGKEARALNIHKALLVTDQGVEASGLITGAKKSLEETGISVVVFSDVEEDPGTKTAEKGLEVLKKENCDGVVIVGGGSPLCAGKAIALLATNGGSLVDYEGNEKYKHPPLPVIGIPTTAGSGSEVSATFIITDEERNYKMSISGQTCYPKVAILDPALLINIPYWAGMNAGMDALSHAIGALSTNLATPITDALAISAAATIIKNLAASVLTRDLVAKDNQLIASTMANIACGNARLDLIHALSHPLGSRHMPHGLANGILIPYVMEFNLPFLADKFAQIGTQLGITDPYSTIEDRARNTIERIKDIYRLTGYPTKIPPEVAKEEDIPEMVEQAMTRPMVQFNRRRCTERDLAEIYRRALAGWEENNG